MIPATQKKLREARFFLERLRQRDRVSLPAVDEFEFYLSAFLSAARSVTFALHAEEKEKYVAWQPTWPTILGPDDLALLVGMKQARNVAQKRGGVPVQVDWEFVPLTEAKRDEQGRPFYGFQWFGPVTAGLPKVGQPVHRFNLGKGEIEATSTCARYLDILERLVSDFVRRH